MTHPNLITNTADCRLTVPPTPEAAAILESEVERAILMDSRVLTSDGVAPWSRGNLHRYPCEPGVVYFYLDPPSGISYPHPHPYSVRHDNGTVGVYSADELTLILPPVRFPDTGALRWGSPR